MMSTNVSSVSERRPDVLINKEVIHEFKPCADRYKNFLEHYSDFSGGLKDLFALDKITHQDKLWVAFRVISKKKVVECAVIVAEGVLGVYETRYPKDNRPRSAIEAARAWLSDPNDVTASAYAAADAATHAAADAATHAAAAYAATHAAASHAVNAITHATAATHDAAYAAHATYAATAANAATYAAHAAHAADKEKVEAKQLQIILRVLGEEE